MYTLGKAGLQALLAQLNGAQLVPALYRVVGFADVLSKAQGQIRIRLADGEGPSSLFQTVQACRPLMAAKPNPGARGAARRDRLGGQIIPLDWPPQPSRAAATGGDRLRTAGEPSS